MANRIRILSLFPAAVAVFALGWWQKSPCQAAGWPFVPGLLYGRRCYSDIPFLFFTRGMADGLFPYAPGAGDHPLEYPVLTGYAMDLDGGLTRWLVPPSPYGLLSRAYRHELSRMYFGLAVLALLACALLVVWATWRTTGRWRDGLLVAIAPSLVLVGTINWDLLAVAATSLALLAWQRRRPWLAGVLTGLGVAAKLYPGLLLVGFGLLAWRARRDGGDVPAPRTVLPATLGAAGAWLVTNVPVALVYPHGWWFFFAFNQQRGAQLGSIWFLLSQVGVPLGSVNVLTAGLLLAAVAGIAAVTLRARRAPGPSEVSFLLVAAFILANKVYSPQYVLWLVPLAVVAGLGLADLVVWQVAEAVYWLALWAALARSASDGWYLTALGLHLVATGWLCARVLLRRPGPAVVASEWPVAADPSRV